MQWIAVHCPQLALEHAMRGTPDLGVQVIIENGLVLHASEAARAYGIHPGLQRATAQALCATLHCIERDPAGESETLAQIASWLLQFTPTVSLQPPEGVLLEVQASLRLFGGVEALCERLRAGLGALGFSVRLAIAPTAAAAGLLARWQDGVRVDHPSALADALAAVPVAQIDAAAPHREALAAVGVHHVGDLLRLPRSGLARRWGPALLEQLDTALGRRADPRRGFEAPPRFAIRLALHSRVEHAAGLLFGAQRMLGHLSGWLAARQAATGQVRITVEHDGNRHVCAPTCIGIHLAQPSRDPQRLLAVLKERLATIRLPAPAEALRLECDQAVPMPSCSGELFPSPGAEAEGLARLIERMQARLGRDRIHRLLPAADHRPEAAYRIEPLEQRSRAVALPVSGMPRPLWLLSAPVPLTERDQRPWWRGPLTLLAGPERIETGWWDEGPVQRDYFIAEGRSTGWVWIFRTRTPDDAAGWFLQGLFG